MAMLSTDCKARPVFLKPCLEESMIAPNRLHAYFRAIAADQHTCLVVPPFTLFLHPTRTEHDSNYAMPDSDPGDDLAAFADVRAAFVRAARIPSVQFVEAFAPRLGTTLSALGFHETARRELLACAPATYHPAAAVPDLSFVLLSHTSPLQVVQEGLDANARGFDPAAPPTTEAEASAFRDGLVTSRAFTAKLHDQPVGAGRFTTPIDGITELVGITTLAPYRGRGIAAALTSEIIRVAFSCGVDTVLLSTDNDRAYRVYQRIGFRPTATLVTYSEPSIDNP
jgi:ribosomal protein S18 acetylase RimI-like enzyme